MIADLHNSLNELRRLKIARGSKEKLAIMAQNKDDYIFRRLLYYACHPQMSYKVSETTLLQPVEYDPRITLTFTNIFEVCETLARRKALDDTTIYQVKAFLSIQNDEDRDIYTKLIAKTLRLGVTEKTVNKAITGLIPEWEVQQAYPIDKYPFSEGTWFSITQKLNGVRSTYYKGEMRGRSGAVMSGLEHITNVLNQYDHMVFDGELTLKDKDGISDNEAFRIATGIVNSENDDKSRICYTIFDLLPDHEFDQGRSSAAYCERRKQLDRMIEELGDNENVHVLPAMYCGTDQSVIETMLNKVISEDKEGLMINLDVPYQCKRHRGILKVKRFYTMDLPIIRCEPGTGRFHNTLGSIVVDFNGVEVGVGSGFTEEQRDWFWEHKEEIIGTLAEVKYKEISFDKSTGNCSLQFPIFGSLRADKKEVSFG